ncbi:hypothetical protein HBI84_161470 [Parastagonospora nodorum]|nr:hypothetical protein HBI84_161470 [Parastagonospora nodorum]
MAGRDSDDDKGYRITTLEVVELVEDLISYLAVAKCIRLRNAQIPKVFYEAAYGAKVKTEDLSNTLTLILSKTAQRRSSSVVSNRSTASITDKFGVALLTEPAILNDANVALVDAVHYSVVIDALMMTLIEDDDDLLGTVNSYIKSRRLRALLLPEQLLLPKKRGRHSKLILDGPPLKRCKTEAADSRHAKASGRRTKKDKDLEDSDTGSDVLRLRRRDRAAACARLAERKRLGKEAQLKKTRDEEELAKAKKEKEEKEARERETYSLDIDPEDDLEDEEATTAKDLLTTVYSANKQTRTRDGLSVRVGTAMEHYAYILYFKELLSDNGGIFANAIGIGKTRAIVLAMEVQNARAESDAIEHNAVNNNDKLCSTKGERTFYCACERSLSFNGRAANAWKNEVVAMDLANSTYDSSPENIGRLTKEEVIEMRINTTNAISKALAAANKLVALQSYVLGGTIPEANTPAVHSKATKYCLAPLAARFVIVCGFRKVDKHVFRAYNTMSVTAQRTIIRKGGSYIEKRAILLSGYVTILIFVSLALISLQNRKGVSNWFNATDKRDSVTGDSLNGLAMAKQWRNMIANVKHDASEHESSYEFMLKRILKTRDLWGKLISGIKGDFLTVQNAEQQCRDILEKEGLDESEASRRVIFNCFKMQAIFKTYGSRKVKRFTLNSVKDLFTNLSKDYFLVREARAITKSSLNIAAEDAAKAANILLLLKEVRAKILIGSYKPIVQAVTWLGLREKFSDESVLVMQRGITQHEINLKLAKWRDLDGPWIIVALMAFAEAITLTEATHVLAEMCVGIVYFNLDSELELKVLGKQDVKITS